MINSQMTKCNILTLGTNEYGEDVFVETTRKIKVAINLLSERVIDSVVYSNSTYIGLTYDNTITDGNVILWNDKRLMIEYVNPIGRMTQLFLKEL